MKNFYAMVKTTTGKDNKSKEKKLTWMLFSVVAIFLVANTTYYIAILLHQKKIISLETLSLLRPIYSFLMTMNSSLNLFLYLLFNSVFSST